MDPTLDYPQASGSHIPQSDPAPEPKKRRIAIACKRCRISKSKCYNDGKPPCKGCTDAGKADKCVFPERGTSHLHRLPTKQRLQATAQIEESNQQHNISTSPENDGYPDSPPRPSGSEQSPSQASRKRRRDSQASGGACHACHRPFGERHDANDRNSIPPMHELVETCTNFFHSYYQFSFLHEATFMDRLEKGQIANDFLLLSMLSMAARFSPTLVARFGSPTKAVNHFHELALAKAPQAMLSPDLEKLQAFLCLALSDWGMGHGKRNWLLTGIATRMAISLKLNEASTYSLPSNPTSSQIIACEEARRTWWILLLNEDMLSSGASRAGSFLPFDYSLASLPSNEDDFAFGQLSPITYFPSYLLPGAGEPDPARPPFEAPPSILASAIVTSSIWSRVARRATRKGGHDNPWTADSEFSLLSRQLHRWVDRLPSRFEWSTSNLRSHKARNLDLAYISHFCTVHLAEIVLRRVYLPNMGSVILADPNVLDFSVDNSAWKRGYWQSMAKEMFTHCLTMIERIEALAAVRPFENGSTPYLGFALYMSAATLFYLCRWPKLCPEVFPGAQAKVFSSMDLLARLANIWPMSGSWHATLARASQLPINGTRGVNQISQHMAEEELGLDAQNGLYRNTGESPASTDEPLRRLQLPGIASFSPNIAPQAILSSVRTQTSNMRGTLPASTSTQVQAMPPPPPQWPNLANTGTPTEVSGFINGGFSTSDLDSLLFGLDQTAYMQYDNNFSFDAPPAGTESNIFFGGV